MRVLVIAPHPDDEVIGCGGTIAKHVAHGDSVYVLVMTQIYAPEWDIKQFDARKKESLDAAKILGIKEVYYAGFPTAKLNTVATISLSRKIDEIVKKIKPKIVYLPPKKDVNVDHTMVHNAAMTTLKSRSEIDRIIAYEIPTVFRYGEFEKNYYVDISSFLPKKLKAMQQYRLEIRKYPHPRSKKGLETIAGERGLAIGVKYAEAFCIVREVYK